jgi:hypothetical protein
MRRYKRNLAASTIAIFSILLGSGSAAALYIGDGENMQLGRAHAPKVLSLMLRGEWKIDARGLGIGSAGIASLPKPSNTEQFGSSPHWAGGRDFPSFPEIVEHKLDSLGRDALELPMPARPGSDSASPVPEPSAALVFGVGILVSSRALRRSRGR